jgi:hypothetical protein
MQDLIARPAKKQIAGADPALAMKFGRRMEAQDMEILRFL